MELITCRDVRWKGPKKRNKPDVAASAAKHRDSRSQISRYGWRQPACIRSVSFWGKFTSGSRISASRSDLLKLPNISEHFTVQQQRPDHNTGSFCPTLYDKRVGSFTFPANHNIKDAGDGAYGL